MFIYARCLATDALHVSSMLGKLAVIKGRVARITDAIAGITVIPPARENELVWAQSYVRHPGISFDYAAQFVSGEQQQFLTNLKWENWRNAEREAKQQIYAIQTDQQLANAFRATHGPGQRPVSSDRNKIIETLLDEEFGKEVNTVTAMIPCERCRKPTPHKLSVVQTDDTEAYNTLQCSICSTWNKVLSEHFQANLDTPSNTDFDT
jgi:hypothetical protein